MKQLLLKIINPPISESVFKIILWWEIRRIPYNVILIISILTGFFFAYYMLTIRFPDEFIDLDFFLAGLLIVVSANICYTGGWFVDILIRKLIKPQNLSYVTYLWIGGSVFTVFICFLPGFMHLVLYLVN